MLDSATLYSIGIILNAEEEATLLEQLQATLEARVGVTIVQVLSPKQEAELVHLTQYGTSDEITSWIMANVPRYEEIVHIEYDILLGEVAEHADEIHWTKGVSGLPQPYELAA